MKSTITLTLLVAFISTLVEAQTIPVGLATVDITPRSPVQLINESELPESQDVAQPLFAKAIAFGSDTEVPAILITFDGIGIPGPVAEAVADRLRKKRNLPRENIAVCATHTHWAPHLTGLLPTIYGGPLPSEEQDHVDAYTRELIDNLERAALEALDNRTPALLKRAVGTVKFAANRRLEGNGRIVTDDALMFTWNPDGPVDHDLPVLAITDPAGNLRAIHLSYACHNVAITGRDISGFRNRIHGDWAGLAREIVEDRHPACSTSVAIGCGGDLRPSPVGGLSVATAHAREIADEIDTLLADPTRWQLVTGPVHCTFARRDLPLEAPPSREELRELIKAIGTSRNASARGHLARARLNLLERGPAPPPAVPFSAQSFAFGKSLAMLFLAGEVVVDFKHRIDEEFDGAHLWVTAYANATPCYIVSRRMLEAGGYEAGNSMNYYGWLSPLTPAAEDIVIETVAAALSFQ